MTIAIAPGDPTDPQVARMIGDSDRYYADLYPAESNHLLDPASLRAPNVLFLVARDGETICGFGAVVATPPYGEIKRMYVDRAARRRGIGRDLLVALEQRARQLRLTCLRLETGVRQREAIALYAANGFAEIRPFGDYAPDPLSTFMEKSLS
ncbi:MAG TPA: GNAT family N-acetyltransferase [Xanthobacteraceae bacterium]